MSLMLAGAGHLQSHCLQHKDAATTLVGAMTYLIKYTRELWNDFDATFDWNIVARAFVDGDIAAATLYAQLYEGMRQMCFGRTNRARSRLARMLHQLEWPNDTNPVIVAPDEGSDDETPLRGPPRPGDVEEARRDLERMGIEDQHPRQIEAIKVVRRFQVRKAKRVKLDDQAVEAHSIIHESRCEVDNHADTTCCGNNFRPIEYTDQSCEVRGFHSELESLSDVPVATCATAWTHPVSRVRPSFWSSTRPYTLGSQWTIRS